MADEKPGQGHDKVCAEATGHTCICECRGRMHGMRAHGGHGSKLRRMGDVSVTAKNASGKADTAAERRRNPVTVTTSSGAKVTSNTDSHGVAEGSRAAKLRDEQAARIRESKAAPALPDESKLPRTQAKDLAILRGFGGREVSDYEFRTAGAGTAAVRELIKKGFVTERRGPFKMPTGPYAGNTLEGQSFFTPVPAGGGDRVPDVSHGKGPGATISKADAAEIMHGPVVAWKDKRTGTPVRNPSQVEIVRGSVVRDTDREARMKAKRAAATGGTPTMVKPAPVNNAAKDAAEVKPPTNATPDAPAISSNEPLWMDKRTGHPVTRPSQVAIVRGDVVRDRRREDIRAAKNAKPGDAVETDLFGTSTIMGGATNSNDKPKPKTTGPAPQQLGMFADESKELDGQGALLGALNPDAVPDAYDRPTAPTQHGAVLDRPAVPADLRPLDDAALGDLVANTPDGPELERVLGELDRRDQHEQYRRLVDSVPDEAGLAEMSEEDVTAMFVSLTSTNGDVDDHAVARVEADLERRGAEERQQAEDDRALRTYVDQVIADPSDENDLEKAAEYARLLGDDDRVIAVFEAWDAKEKREQAQLDEAHKAREKAAADELHAQQEAKREDAARVAAAEAEREKLDAEFRALSRSELARAYVAHAASMDPERQARHAAAKREMDRRAPEWEADDKRAKAAERRRQMMSGPVGNLSDDELRDAIADIEGDGFNSNSTRQSRLGLLREEKAKRDQEAARVAALKAAGPTGPARLRNPIGSLRDLEVWAVHDHGTRDRLVRARMAALGVPEPKLTSVSEWAQYAERSKARKKAIAEAAKADPRSAQEQAATIIAQYRHLAKIDNPATDGAYAHDRAFGPPDDVNAPPLREAAPFEKIPKAYEQFQDIRRQAMQDRANGDNSTAIRVEKAYRRALGLPDDGTDDEIRSAYGGDERSSGDLASQMLVEFRAQAIADGVDPDDRLRYGPKEKKPKASTSPGYRVKPTPQQEAEVDRRVSAGEDYIEAYADVYGLDPDAMRRDQGPKLTAPQVKAAYEEHVHLQYIDAENVTAGHMLSAKGKAKGVDPKILFSGSLTAARPYASEELLRYWADNERLSFADFKANLSGNIAAIKARKSRSNGRDFV